ncbi:VpaChn25_0724 family phage protein [Desulfovibrio psychrotolerans]|uniref:ArsR family transcriptional regulator n=1 Tax=Desulfovibrio psychrotolerans TaxID=415242 RepID=A0A7J0BWZ2_9BACT|nr:ArsR family transcriptional regulator [Desulfovibrio psychrotolerans]GFM37691.1 hypothetical protein DSM19430T_23750 [Desulfovibrio psychrotolerans]
MSFQTVLAEDRRLCILRLLSGSPGREANHYVLKTALQSLGHAVSHDVVKGDLAWLDAQGLVATSDKSDVTVATLRAYGQDVADGVASVPGVKRPMPGE